MVSKWLSWAYMGYIGVKQLTHSSDHLKAPIADVFLAVSQTLGFAKRPKSR